MHQHQSRCIRCCRNTTCRCIMSRVAAVLCARYYLERLGSHISFELKEIKLGASGIAVPTKGNRAAPLALRGRSSVHNCARESMVELLIFSILVFFIGIWLTNTVSALSVTLKNLGSHMVCGCEPVIRHALLRLLCNNNCHSLYLQFHLKLRDGLSEVSNSLYEV